MATVAIHGSVKNGRNVREMPERDSMGFRPCKISSTVLLRPTDRPGEVLVLIKHLNLLRCS